eukprot:356139-Chlamydomonas_euryale.AAC.12
MSNQPWSFLLTAMHGNVGEGGGETAWGGPSSVLHSSCAPPPLTPPNMTLDSCSFACIQGCMSRGDGTTVLVVATVLTCNPGCMAASTIHAGGACLFPASTVTLARLKRAWRCLPAFCKHGAACPSSARMVVLCPSSARMVLLCPSSARM